MSEQLNKWWSLYLRIGVVFAIPIALSYFWQLSHYFAHMESGKAGFFPLLLAFGWCFFAPVMRTLTWLPSLVVWFIHQPHDMHSFLLWLTPGFYQPGGLSWHL